LKSLTEYIFSKHIQ